MRNQSEFAAPETLVLTGLEGASKVKNFVIPRAVHTMDNTGDDAAIVQFSILPSIPFVVSLPRLHVGQEIGDHLKISLCLLQMSGM